MDIHNIFDDILDKLNQIEKRLDSIEQKLGIVQSSGQNMDRHITFIENIYDKVKYPFFYFFNTISSLTSYRLTNKHDLIEDKD